MQAPHGLPFNVVMQDHIWLLASSVQRMTDCWMLNAGASWIAFHRWLQNWSG